MKPVVLIFFLCFANTNLLSQGEIDSTKKIFYRNEQTIGFLLNSNGLGGSLRFAKHPGGFSKYLIDLDFNWIQHSKEIKTNSLYYDQKSYIYGKLNSFYSLRIGVGKQKEMFSKFDKGGIAIRYFFVAGPVLGIVKPKYYEVSYDNLYTYVIEDFETYYYNVNNNHANGYIVGNASFLEGIDKTKFEAGVFFKFGFSFEYSNKDNMLNAIEAGTTIEAFPKKIPIMKSEESYWLFPAFFLSYRFGKIYDPYVVKTK